MGLEVGFLGLLILIADVWAILKVAGAKAIWIVAILVLPVLGLIAWFFFGPKS
jgi:hypothetical protein